MEALFIPDDLDGDGLSRAMVPTMEDLTKGAFAKSVNDFVSECQMVMVDNLIIASVVVIAIIVRRIVQSRKILLATCTDVIYVLIVKNFLSFIVAQILVLIAFEYS